MAAIASCVSNQTRKSFVHMILMVAMEERLSRIIGDKINLCL